MRRKNCKRLLAGILCVVMILTNGAVTGSLVQASEVGQMGKESPVAELPDASTEPREETRPEENREQTNTGESAEDAGDSSKGLVEETEASGEDSKVDKTENSDAGNDSEGLNGSEEESGSKDETDGEEENGSKEESGKNESENPNGNVDAGNEENTEGNETETPAGEDNEVTDEETIRPEYALTTSADDIASGTSGNISWVIDVNGKLIVNGTGDFEMRGGLPEIPWADNKEYIKTAEINLTGMTDASYMFDSCRNMTSINLVNFDTSNIVNMCYMFCKCNNLTVLDISNFNTSNVTNMNNMFYGCYNLTKLDVSNFDTSNVTDMSRMFDTCLGLTEINVSNFNTSNVTNMSRMFDYCYSLSELDVSSFDTSNVTDMSGMFGTCLRLAKLDVSNFDTSNVTNMSDMFNGCPLTELNLSNFDTSKVTNMSNMFNSCQELLALDVSSFDTSKVTDMDFMFSECFSLPALNIRNFNTNNVTSMCGMFCRCLSLSELDLSNFNMQNVSDASSMLFGFYSGTDDICNLTRIYTPYNLTQSVELPTNSGDVWYRSDGSTITELPQNLSYSIVLGKNYIPDEKEIKPSVDDIEITKDKFTIIIHDENTKEGIEAAAVMVNNILYTTSKDGMVLVNAASEKKQMEITVTAENYEDIITAKEASNGMILHIYMIPKSDDLRITNVIADMDGQKYDLLRGKIMLGYYNDLDKLSNFESGNLNFIVRTNHKSTLYELLAEDETVVMENTTGVFSIPTIKSGNTTDGGTITANMPLESILKQGKYQLRVTGENDRTITVGIGLTCTVNYLTLEREKMSGKFSLGNAFEVQIADDVPFIGGGTYKFGFEDKLPVDVSIDGDGKLKVAINKPADVDFNKYKENYNNLAQKAKSASKLASKFGKVEGFGAGYFDIDGSICGYGEGNISELGEGNITIKVGIIATLEGSGHYKQYFMAGFVPLNVSVDGEASVSADLNASVPLKNWKITGLDLADGTMTGKGGLTVGAGIGVGIELNASGNGSINYTWKPAKNYQKAWLEGSIKVEEVLLFWTKTLWESPKYTYTIMEKGSKGKSVPEIGFNDTQETTFVPINRSYLDYSEGFLNTMSADTESTGISTQSVDGKTIVKAAIYPSASPVMTQVGNTKYLFWVEDIASRSANNIGAIVYSESQDNVTWSEPKRLLPESEDNTFDGSFHIFTSGQKIYITWQDGTNVLEDSASMQQVLKSMSVRRAILDAQTGEVTVTDSLTKENGYYMYPCTIEKDNICYIAYIHNTLDSGDVYGNNTQYLYCIKEGNSNPQTLDLPQNGIVVNMVSGIFDSKASVVCEIDMDGSLATSEDREIYLWDMANGSRTRLTDNATMDSMPVISESGRIYWYQDGNIMYLKSQSESAQGIWSQQTLAAPVYFSVATGQDNRDIVLWEMSDSDKLDGSVAVYGSQEMGDGTWQNISKCAESQGTIASRLSAVGDWDHLMIAHLEGIFTEDGTLLKDLCVLGREDMTDISLDYVECDEDQIHSGAALPMQAVITNHGNTVVDDIQFTVDSTAIGNVGSLNLQPGESREIAIDGFTVPSDLNGKREFMVSAVVQGDLNDADNTQSITLETTVYRIDTATRLDRGGTWLDFTVWNEGDHPTSGVARVHKSTENGDIVYETDFHSLPSEHGYACSVDLSDYEDSVTHYYVEALPDYAKDEDSNDSEFVYIGYGTGVEEQIETTMEQPVESITLSNTETWLRAGESIRLTATANTGTALFGRELIWSSYDVSIASVDNTGNITAHRNGTTYITVTYGDLYAECAVNVGKTIEKTYSITFDTQGGDPIKSISGLHAGDIVTLPSANKEGMTFLGWFTQAVGGEKIENFTIEVQESITLYAHWDEGDVPPEDEKVPDESEKTYSITFDTQGGDPIKSITGLHIGDIVTLPKSANKNGMIFLGWYTQAIGGKKIEGSTIMVQESITLYAHWSQGDILPEDMPEDGKIPDGLWIAAISDTVYTGKAIKPVPHVYDSDVRLKAGTDYIVTYKNNVKASDASNVPTAPTIIVTGKGNYSGKDTIIFKILPMELTESNMTVADMTSAYNQQIQEPVPSITVNGKKLKRQTDFFVSYPDYTPGAYRDIGTYRISITGTGNYTGEQTLTFDITDKLLISKASVSKIRNQAYTGKAVTPAPVVKYQNVGLVEHKDYELEYQNNVDIGKATVVIKGIGDYAGKKTVFFQITGGSIKKAKVTGLVSPIVYSGEELLQNCSLSMLVNDVDIPLKEGKDYTVTYKNNIKAGTAKVIFTGINGYTGKLQKSYKIAPYDILSNNSSYIEYTKNIVCTYLKGGCRPEPDLYFKGTLLKKGVDYTLSYRNNNAVRGEQIPTIIVKGKGSFKNKIEIPFTIEPQNLSNMTLASCDKVYEDKANIYKITPKLLDINGKALSAGKDFDKNSITYAYENDVVLEDGVTKKAGNKVEATDIIPANTRIRVTLACGSGDLYKGTFTGTYRIVAADIKTAKVSIPAQIYTGSEIKPDKTQIRITLSELYLSPEDYDIVSYANNIKKGKASVTIIGKGNYGGTKTVKFTIKAKGFLWWWR